MINSKQLIMDQPKLRLPVSVRYPLPLPFTGGWLKYYDFFFFFPTVLSLCEAPCNLTPDAQAGDFSSEELPLTSLTVGLTNARALKF